MAPETVPELPSAPTPALCALVMPGTAPVVTAVILVRRIIVERTVMVLRVVRVVAPAIAVVAPFIVYFLDRADARRILD